MVPHEPLQNPTPHPRLPKVIENVSSLRNDMCYLVLLQTHVVPVVCDALELLGIETPTVSVFPHLQLESLNW